MFKKKYTFRVIKTLSKSSKENMAIDEALLLNFNKNNHPILRLYTWHKNSITIGISQEINSHILEKYLKNNCSKRITGGGILFHGHDVSYSLVLPIDIFENLNIKKSYEVLCMFILNFYKKLGLNTCYAKDDESVKLSKSEFCQIGFEAYDILTNGIKMGGNAQRRTKHGIFQHGSIPVYSENKSNVFNEKLGISLESLNIKTNFEKVKDMLVDSFADTFKVEIEHSNLTENEKETKEKLLKDKYDYDTKQQKSQF